MDAIDYSAPRCRKAAGFPRAGMIQG